MRKWLACLCLLGAGLALAVPGRAAAYDYGDQRSVTLTTKAWGALNQNDLEAVLAAEGGAAFDIASRSFPSEAADFGAAECATGACPVSPVRKNPRDVMS